MGELLGFEAAAGVELYLEPLAAARVDPLAVDAFVLFLRPGVLEFVQLKALTLQAFDVFSDTLGERASRY